MSEVRRQLTIVSLNARGEGVAADGTVAPLALPGETALAETDGERVRVVALTVAAPERAEPICGYFGRCGGCAAQHMSQRLYAAWKRDGVVRALQRAGVAAEVGPLIDAHGEGRRRATFHARFVDGREQVGFMRARAHDIIAVDACPLFAPGLAGAIRSANALAAAVRGISKPLDIQATATLGGLDFDLRGSGAPDDLTRRKLAAAAERLDLARLSVHGETIVERRPPEILFGDVLATPPPGGFLQATEAGEQALADGAAAALSGAKRIADLFCGAGAFALRLARQRGLRRRRRRGGGGGARARRRRGVVFTRRPRRDPRPLPPAAHRRGAGALRRRAVRPAARRGRGAGARARRGGPAARRRHFLQRRQLRPRRAHPHRRRLRDRAGRGA